MRTPSGLDVLDVLINRVRTSVSDVLDVSGTRFRDANQNNSSIFFVGWNSWRWTELPEESTQVVRAAKEAVEKLSEFSARASRGTPDAETVLAELDEKFIELVEQPDTYAGAARPTIPQVREYLEETLSKYGETLRQLPNAQGASERLVVADTSALLDFPDLQVWKLDGQSWTVIILPQVLAELDEKKRDPRTRDAARKVVNMLEELDRRGNTLEGVRVAGKLSAREVPKSPDMSATLGWLRADVPDDLIIAGALEIAWGDLTSRVAVVASDRNVRNKARLAGLTPIRAGQLTAG